MTSVLLGDGVDDKPPVVRAARLLRRRELPVVAFRDLFGGATVFTQISGTQLMVSDVPEMGTWVSTYSTLQRLAEVAGDDSEYVAMPGRDLLRTIPDGIGVVIDPGSEHMIALPPQGTGRQEAGAGDARL
ncbi:SseB family protein [Pseudonocardiaceae bacterium YIM PH 21723]|nr:SseB family protein [Pseudonocardiaceae bacterium YIM PH 21723]